MSQVYEKLQSIIKEGPDKKSYLGEDDFVEVSHRNIRLAFHLRHPHMDLARLIGTIRRIDMKLQTHLNLTIGTIEVEIHQSRAEWIRRHTLISEGDPATWIKGDSGRMIRIFMNPLKEPFKKLQLMVTHECVHRALAEHCGKKPPAWIDEGLAIYFSQELPDTYRDCLREAVAADSLLPIDLLERPFTTMNRRLKTLAYAQSGSIIEYLQNTYGWKLLREILRALSRGDNLDIALKARELTLYLMEREWQKSLS